MQVEQQWIHALLGPDRIAVEVMFHMRIDLSTNKGNKSCIMFKISKTRRFRWAQNENSGESSRKKRGGDH